MSGVFFGIDTGGLPSLALGVVTGMTYGILAVGLVLIYRSNRIINFAHGEIGALGAGILVLAVIRWNVPYWLALPAALAAAAAVAALVEAAVVRRLRSAPKLMSVVGTLGAGQVIALATFTLTAKEMRTGAQFPKPTGLPEFEIGVFRMTQAHTGILLLTPLLVVALTLFLRRSRTGLAMRASASNPEAARLATVPAARMSTIAWVIAGAISALTAILVFPTRGLVTAELLGPTLLVRALAPAVVARMQNLPVAFAAGVVTGIVEQVINLNTVSAGVSELLLFGAILVALAWQRRTDGRGEARETWTLLRPWRPVPAQYEQVWLIRNLPKLVALAALAAALLVAVVSTNRVAIVLVSVIGVSLVGLSVGVITGLAGHLSLGQFALAGIGLTTSYAISVRTGNFFLGYAGAGAVAALVGVAVGIPAVRSRGLMAAVSTLSFALVTQTWLLQQSWALGSGVNPGRPVVGSFAIDTGKRYYLLALGVLVVTMWFTRNVWRGGLGRSFSALRDNHDAARAFCVPALRRKVQAFAIAGFVAGVGGAVFGHALASASFQNFPVGRSIDVVAISVIGGLGVLAGPIVGAFYVIGLPSFVELDSFGAAATAAGWLVLILYFPGGLPMLVAPLRERLLDGIARRKGIDPEVRRDVRVKPQTLSEISRQVRVGAPSDTAQSSPNGAGEAGAGRVILDVREMQKAFGGVRAVDGVSFEVHAGETLGLIGPNGAGKTTLFELVSGFTAADEGRVVFDGRDVTRMAPEGRGRLGLIRSFQDAYLFPTLTVLDTVRLAHERRLPTQLVPEILGLHGKERQKDARARELVDLMGLHPYVDTPIGELSTGTRRITELACLLALEPSLLLLDEPSSGVAQRETEALAELLGTIRAQLHTTLVIIEHDLQLVAGLSDRMLAMANGRIIASGSPDEVLRDDEVARSYIGSDETAIHRSGALSPNGARRHAHEDERCRSETRSGSRCSRAAVVDGMCRQHAALVR